MNKDSLQCLCSFCLWIVRQHTRRFEKAYLPMGPPQGQSQTCFKNEKEETLKSRVTSILLP